MTGGQKGTMRSLILVDLDENGNVLSGGEPVAGKNLSAHFGNALRIPPKTTDIFVFAHGWRNTENAALSRAQRLFRLLTTRYLAAAGQYPRLAEFRPVFVAVRWKSRSRPLGGGYRFIRDRAHALTTRGHAAHILASLLGYLDSHRDLPHRGASTLFTKGGQYLHCIGHSLGGRVLGEAIMAAADPSRPPTLGWPWLSEHPFAVDSLTVFQMAAPADIFSTAFAPMLDVSPIHGPIVLTHSEWDHATGAFHRAAEKVKGIGRTGAASGGSLRLKTVHEPYLYSDFPVKVMSVDATWCFTRSGLPGAHSGYVQPESAHLLLSLADLSRPSSA